MTDMKPIIVKGPEPKTPLQTAKWKLFNRYPANSKYLHLSPRESDDLANYVLGLERIVESYNRLWD